MFWLALIAGTAGLHTAAGVPVGYAFVISAVVCFAVFGASDLRR